jgi:maleylpyruvate isomerase
MTGPADDPMITRLVAETERLLGSLSGLDDRSAREPSRLPGWSRGHVLTHLARNADALARVAQVAVTGQVQQMYASAEQRDADIEAGAGRPIGELAADVEASAQALLAVLRAGREDLLDDAVPTGRGWDLTARQVPWLRLREVVYHHVDLAGPFTFRDLPDELVRTCLKDCVLRLEPAPALQVAATFGGQAGLDLRIGAASVGTSAPGGPAVRTVRGPGPDLLSWLTGRSSGAGLRTDDGAALPTLPAWG